MFSLANTRRIWERLLVVGCCLLPLLVGCGKAEKKGLSLSQQAEKARAITDPGLRAREYIKLAGVQKKVMDDLGCEGSLAAAGSAAASLEDPIARGSLQTAIGIGCAQLERKSDAKKYLSAAAESISTGKEVETKIAALADLASATAEHLGNPDLAAEQLQKAEAEIATIESASSKVTAWGRVFAAYAKLKNTTETDRLTKVVEAYAQSLEKPRDKAESLAQWALTLAQAKQKEPAKAAFEAAALAVETIDEPESQAYASLHVGQKMLTAGNAAAAKAQLTKAEAVGSKIKDGSIKGPLMEEVNTSLDKAKRASK